MDTKGHSMAVKQKKRRWQDDEKRSICFQTTAAGVSVAQVASRYAMNANLIFKWLKDQRYAPDADAVPEEVEPVFLPKAARLVCQNYCGSDRKPRSETKPEWSHGCWIHDTAKPKGLICAQKRAEMGKIRSTW